MGFLWKWGSRRPKKGSKGVKRVPKGSKPSKNGFSRGFPAQFWSKTTIFDDFGTFPRGSPGKMSKTPIFRFKVRCNLAIFSESFGFLGVRGGPKGSKGVQRGPYGVQKGFRGVPGEV